MKKKSMLDLHRISTEEFKQVEKIPVAVVLDDVRSEMNVGSVFRTADAFVINHIALCGITATPPRQEIHKTALGAEDTVSWSYHKTAVEAIEMLRKQGYTICSIEQVHGSVSLEKFPIDEHKKYALVFGNEVKGVSQAVVDKSDFCIELPQYGTKHSLNISCAAAIVMWHFFNHLKLIN